MAPTTASRSTPPRVAEPAPSAQPPPLITAEQHTLLRSTVLHLFPGLALATFVVLTASTFESWGLPALFALVIGIGVVIAPLELGYLVVHARRRTGSWSPMATHVMVNLLFSLLLIAAYLDAAS
jgi:hypothetical protein